MIYYYTQKILNEDMNKDIVRLIDEHSEENKNVTYIKAGMTGWRMQSSLGFNILSTFMCEFARSAAAEKYKTHIIPEIYNMWGAKYVSGDHAKPHHHYPSLWSCLYYINPPENCPGLIIMDDEDGSELEIPLEHGLLILLEGNVKHRVDAKPFSGVRYVVAANINHALEKK
jgi:hypothetical protein